MIRFHAEGEREGPVLGAPAPLQAKPEELLDELKAGRLRSITFSANVFVSGPNRNHFQIPDGELEAFARSFEGLPFLKDHDEQLASVGGRITKSELVARGDGRKAIRQSIMANKPWAMENVLDGTVNRFSIGWFARRQVCTSCEADFLSKDCAHMPWDLGKNDAKGNVVELRTEGCEGREVSAVVTPAVPDTGIEALMRAKEELMTKAEGSSPAALTEEEGIMSKTILAALGLAEEAEESKVLAAIEQLKAPRLPAPLLTALGLRPESTADEAVATVVRMTAPDAFVSKGDFEQMTKEHLELKAKVRVAELIAKGKIAPANEAWALRQAVENPAGFAVAFPDDAPRVTALGTPPPAVLREEPKLEVPKAGKIAQRLGVTDVEYQAEILAEQRLLAEAAEEGR